MSENNPNPNPNNEPTPTPNPEPTPTPTPEPEKTIPYTRFKEVNDKLSGINTTLKELGFDNLDGLKSVVDELKTFKQQDEEKKRSERTELENLSGDLTKANDTIQSLKEANDKLLNQMKNEKVLGAFKEEARKNNIEYIDAALKLTDLSKLSLNENGEVQGVSDVVKGLIEQNPFLVKQVETNPTTIGGSTNPPKPADTRSKEEILKEYGERARKSGRHEDMVLYMAKKRELGL